MLDKLKITEKNIEDINFFETTKAIRKLDGTYIKKGSSCLVESLKYGKVEVHFADEPQNRYTNSEGCYKFSLKKINKILKPADLGQYMKKFQDSLKSSEIKFIYKRYKGIENYMNDNANNFTLKEMKENIQDEYLDYLELKFEKGLQKNDNKNYKKSNSLDKIIKDSKETARKTHSNINEKINSKER